MKVSDQQVLDLHIAELNCTWLLSSLFCCFEGTFLGPAMAARQDGWCYVLFKAMVTLQGTWLLPQLLDSPPVK